MKLKRFFQNIKKIPFFCLLVITTFLSDGIYDGILPWPSPFQIRLAYSDRSDDDTVITNAVTPIPETDWNPDDASGSTGAPVDTSLPNHDLSDNAGNGEGKNPDAAADGDEIPDQEGTFQPTDAPAGHSSPAPETGTDDPDMPVPPQPVLGEDGLPLVQYMQVEDDYFDDAVFIGDSRTRSLQLYANLEHTTFLADTGLTIYTVLDKKLTPSTMTSKTTVADYLTDHQFKKIYLMLGINELGTGTAESFRQTYSEVLDQLRALQPDAIIYLQAILHISESKDREHTYINNAAIIERNDALRSLADNEHIFWLDSNPAVCDENDYLIDSYTFDGVHLQAKYVYLWTDYLKQHAILQEDVPSLQSPFPSPQPQAMP